MSARTVYRILCGCVCVLGIASTAHAQSDIDRTIAQAESLYAQGDFELPPQLLSQRLDELPQEQVIRVLRIMALSQLGRGDKAEGSVAMLRLMHHAPAYQPSPNDPPAYVALLEELRGVVSSMANDSTSCADEMAASTSRYREGAFEEAEKLLSECLGGRLLYLPESEYVPALRLLALLQLKMGNVSLATSTVAKLLQLKQGYAPDPVQDPPGYVALVALVSSRNSR